MNRTAWRYLAPYYGAAAGIFLGLMGGFYVTKLSWLCGEAVVLFIVALCLLPGILTRRMFHHAALIEQKFGAQGFCCEARFDSEDAIYYAGKDGRLAVIWRGNPKQLQLVDLSRITAVQIHQRVWNGGVRRVFCRFRVGRQAFEIPLLRSHYSALSEKDVRVLTAIEAAKQLCDFLQHSGSAQAIQVGIQVTSHTGTNL